MYHKFTRNTFTDDTNKRNSFLGDVKILALLKYLGNFGRTLELPIANSDVNVMLK